MGRGGAGLFGSWTLIRELCERGAPRPWDHGGKIPWHEASFSARMLREHLSQQHDRASRRASVIDAHVAWLHGHVLGGRPARVLDLGCGPGLYTSRLARAGHRCVGIDIGPASIAHARREASAAGLACDYVLADLEEVALPGEQDAVLLLSGELNTFPPAAARDLLQRAREALAPGGCLVLEVHTWEAVRALGSAPPTWSAQARGLFADAPHLVLRECGWDEAAQASVERYFVVEEGAEEPAVLASTTQAYPGDGYARLLGDAGLVERERHACLTGGDAQLEPGLFVIVAGAGHVA